ncbi:hypothetical protein [Polaribacter vadi]|uniref:hypothetical protein n=1 Tax=Polaribacter vadi TaxID=1774273 RepID=UPI0030EC7119|tara:strand:+ start:2197 stop:2523 length:327 start_codon:yes stop_codon:yes gene_type:complete
MSNYKEQLESSKKSLKKIYFINIPISIILGIIYSLYSPYLPGRRGRPPMIERMEYSDAILLSAFIFFSILFLSFFFLISKKKINDLERKYNNDKKNIKEYKSVSNFKN